MPAPWSRAPFLLWRRPAVALAIAVAGLLVALPAAAASLFLASSGNATLHNQLERSCKWTVGAQVGAALPFTAPPYRPDQLVGARLLQERVGLVRPAAAQVPRLSEPVVSTLTRGHVRPVPGPPARPDQTAVSLLARDGFREHVRVLAGGAGRGIWLPDGFAAAQRLRVGDRVAVAVGPEPVSMRVAAVYRDLRELPDQPYWCGLRDVYRGKPLASAPVYPLALVEHADLLAAARGSDVRAHNTIEMSVDTEGLTTTDAAPTIAGLRQLGAAVTDRQAAGAYPDEAAVDSTLAVKAARAGLVVDALTGTVVPLAVAGALAGLVIAAAAGAFWADRRRAELAVLCARGVGPAAVAGKAALEAGGAVLVGAAAGWLTARFLVATAGPSPLVTPGATLVSVLGAGAAALAVLAAIAAVAGGRAGRLFDAPPGHRARLSRLPWELVPLAAAGLAWFLLDDDVQLRGAGAGAVAYIPPRLIVAPVLLAAGLAMLTGRSTWWALRALGARSRRRSRSRPPGTSMRRIARFLAWRRVRAAPVVAAVLVGATAVPVALSVYGATVIASVDRTLHAEAQLIVGTDVVFTLSAPAAVPGELAGRASVTALRTDGSLGDTTVHVLGVDPETFPRAAFWDPGLPGPALRELVSRLDPEPARPGAVLAGMPAPADATLELAGSRQSLTITGVPQLPGKAPGNPVLLVHRDVLDRLVPESRPQLWARGDPERIVPAVAGAGLPVSTTSRADQVHAAGVYTGITYTFTFLSAVSLLSGVIIVVGLLLHLDARSRARRSAYVLLSRMAVTGREHRRSLLLEVGGLLLAGFVTGLGTAGVLVLLTHTGYDVDPGTAPGALVTTPWPVLAGLLTAAAATSVLAAAAAHRAAARARPAEVLRDTR